MARQAHIAREIHRGQWAHAITRIFTGSGASYGSSKIWITLVREGSCVSVKTVAKLTAELGLVARKVRCRRGAAPARQAPRGPGLGPPRLHRGRTGPGVVRRPDPQITTGEGL
ncbi:IS3 family transposase [Streptomyces sp. 7N604]|uniref:IS3 family transposase n=1 Tax=Streptomyces sp. 7N604 TaxID=3457415 RepID=UPI003FD1AB03